MRDPEAPLVGVGRGDGGRVLLLASPGLPQRLLAAELARRLPLFGIVVERRPPSTRGRASRLKRRLRRVLGDTLYERLLALKRRLTTPHIERKVERIEGELKRRAETEMLDSLGALPPAGWPAGVETFETPSVNRRAAVAWCRERQPGLILVYGTSILRAPMIRVPTRGVLNAHSSILPSYRGVFSEFWQTLNGQLDTTGVSVQFIDEGVDTGDLVLQRKTASEPGIDPYRLRCRNVVTTLEIYPEAARLVLAGEEERCPQGPSDQTTFRSRDMTFEKRLELLRKLGFEL